MLYALKVLNSDATLNNFQEGSNARIGRGADATVMLRIAHLDKNGLRYIPAVGATLSITLTNSDESELVKTPTQPFADDRSILQLDLSDAETAELISQSLNLEINEGAVKSLAMLAGGLQVASASNDC